MGHDRIAVPPMPKLDIGHEPTNYCIHSSLLAFCCEQHRGFGFGTLNLVQYVDIFGHMDESIAITRFAALAQETRLAVFRLLVTAEPNGLAAGEIARRLDVPHNTMSAHLAVLTRAGLATATRHSRSMIYRAELGAVRETLFYLASDCCNGRPEVCAGLVDALADSPSETHT